MAADMQIKDLECAGLEREERCKERICVWIAESREEWIAQRLEGKFDFMVRRMGAING